MLFMKSFILRRCWFLALLVTCPFSTMAVAEQHDQVLEEHWLRMLGGPTVELKGASAHKNALHPTQDAYGAVNGVRHEIDAFHTSNDETSWWAVDLGKPYPIQRMEIFNRGHADSRAYNLEILFSDDGKAWRSVYKNRGKEFHGGLEGETPLEVSFNGKLARWIRIQLPNDFLHLSEVEAYAVGDEKTNIALKKFATQSSVMGRSAASLPKPILDRRLPEGLLEGLSSKPKGTPLEIARAEYGKYVTPELIAETFALADRTVAYVEKSVMSSPEADLLAKLNAQLSEHKKRWEAAGGVQREATLPSDGLIDTYLALRHLRREILFLHPDLDIETILINRNPPAKYSHNGDQHLGRHSRTGPGLTLLSNWQADPQVKPMLPAGMLPDGAVRNPDLHYDADRVAFAFCDHTQQNANSRRYFLYEAALDGSWVRQITGTKEDPLVATAGRATVPLEDNDPCYLPDDDMVFISTRAQSFGRCHGGRFNPAWPLYRCTLDGKNVRQISFNNENEYEPSVLNDGRIVYTRWEYTNRHEMWFHMLWWCRPDGTEVSNFFGADMLDPMEIVEASAIPNSSKVVATASGHHSYNTGTIIVIDPMLGENGEQAITRITPETGYPETVGVGWPSPHYSHPYPVNGDLFFVSRANHRIHKQGMVPPENDRAIYLIDTLGGREFIYEDPEVASFSPIPIRKRERPPVLPSHMTPGQEYGTLFVQNAYLTRNDPEGLIEPGMIKAIRVNALGVKPMNGAPSVSTTLGVEIAKRVVGTVPVAPDGSAFFKVPANTSLQLQILDENGMAILTEKSFFYVQEGENRSCIGCHEPSGSAPVTGSFSKMARSQPMELQPPAGPSYPGGNSFHRGVQPVLDRYCIRCHGLEKTEKGVNFVSTPGTVTAGLRALVERGSHHVGFKKYMQEQRDLGQDANISRPRRFFAYTNRVAQMLVGNKELAGDEFYEAHKDLAVDAESRQQVIDWMDLNCQTVGDQFRNRPAETRKLDRDKMKELREYATNLLGDDFVNNDTPDRALVNVVQPDQSRVLLAPLSIEDGGWGQIDGYAGRQDEKFQKMEELVEAAIIRHPNENDRGWCPTIEQSGADAWILEERERFFKTLGRDFQKERTDSIEPR